MRHDGNPEPAAHLKAVREVIRTEYRKKHADPWVIAYSGGKDSTLLLHLTYEVVLSFPPQERRRNIYVVGNNTLVESLPVIRHLKKTMAVVAEAGRRDDLPLKTEITEPCIDQTFWVNVIGRGYIPPTRNFRWCTDRMKILPTNRLLEKLILRHKRAVLLIGTRKTESQNRRRTMKKYGVQADKMNPHSTIKGCRMFAPLADLNDEDVWAILLQRKPPWGGTHRNLITLYRNAGGGECPLVLTKDDAPSCGTTSPRFGCWTCTVVKKDKSLRGLIDSGHEDEEKLEALADFREWLIELRENNENRLPVRRNGSTKMRADGTLVYGPFTLPVRKKILDELLHLQKQIDEQLISPSEIEMIEDIWRVDEIREEGRLALIATSFPEPSTQAELTGLTTANQALGA